MSTKDLVSIIVPVYNTEKYLDKCIQSILGQTYTNLDILFINDGSTDGSLQILEKYQAQDNRIRIFSKENGGQGLARNLGIEQAKGEFVMFVDSDDWLSDSCVETLYQDLKESCADVAIGGIAKTFFESEQIDFCYQLKVNRLLEGNEKKEELFDIEAFPFSKLMKRSLFMDYKIRFPSHYFEDACTILVVYAMADRICYVETPLYYYRNRAGSTVNDLQHVGDRFTCVETLIKEFKSRGLYEQYQVQLKEYAIKRSRINKKKVRVLLNRLYDDFYKRQTEFDIKNFGIDTSKNISVYVFGSYNLMIASKISLRLGHKDKIPYYYGSQNLASCVSPYNKKLREKKVEGKNAFRVQAVAKDFEKEFMHLPPGLLNGVDYLILDLLEERYPTGIWEGEFFTESEAFLEMNRQLKMEYSIIESFQGEWRKRWHKNCDRFIEQIKSNFKETKIILVKMKLSEKYVEDGQEFCFPDISRIRYINNCLEDCYQYFVFRCPDLKVVDVEDSRHYYTDKNFRHGCYPWHLNEQAYKEIARRIWEEYG